MAYWLFVLCGYLVVDSNWSLSTYKVVPCVLYSLVISFFLRASTFFLLHMEHILELTRTLMDTRHTKAMEDP